MAETFKPAFFAKLGERITTLIKPQKILNTVSCLSLRAGSVKMTPIFLISCLLDYIRVMTQALFFFTLLKLGNAA